MSLVRLVLADVPTPAGPGLSGLVASIDALLPRAARPFSLAANVLLSGAGVRAYQLDPADNYAFDVELPGVEFRDDAIDIDNYGALEALGGYWGVAPRRYPAPTLAELVQLCRHELGEGRSVLIERRGAPVRYRRVIGVQVGATPAPLAADVAAVAVETLEFDLKHVPPPPAGVDAAWVVRPDPMPGPVTRWHALQLDVLRFAAEHHTRKFELVHDAELFYATGRRALTRTRTLLAGSATHPAGAEQQAFVARWLDEHAQAYALGATGCSEWAGAVERADPAWAAPPGGSEWLRALATALGTLGGALGAAQAALVTGTKDGMKDGKGDAARDLALAALDAAVQVAFPEPPAPSGLFG